MESFIIPELVVWMSLGIFLILAGGLGYFLIKYLGVDKKDMILFIDRNNRFSLFRTDFLGRKEIDIEGSKYFLNEDTSLLNKKGKALYVFSKGKPAPMKIEYNKTQWLDGKTLLAMINNDLVQMMVKPKNDMQILLTLGAIGGIIAGLSSVIILLNQLGVIGG